MSEPRNLPHPVKQFISSQFPFCIYIHIYYKCPGVGNCDCDFDCDADGNGDCDATSPALYKMSSVSEAGNRFKWTAKKFLFQLWSLLLFLLFLLYLLCFVYCFCLCFSFCFCFISLLIIFSL